MGIKKIWKRILPVLLLAALLTGTAAADAPLKSLTQYYAAETALYGEAVCPALMPGSEDGLVQVRWICRSKKPVFVHYGPDDGTGKPAAEHFTAAAECRQTRKLSPLNNVFLRWAEIPAGEGDMLYGLAAEGEEPAVYYPILRSSDEGLRVVMSSDSHVANYKQARTFDETMTAALERGNADLFFHGGDVVENSRVAPYILTHFAPVTRSVPMAAVCGNHDLSGILYDYFDMPHRDAKTGDYWFIQGKVLFVGLNVEMRDNRLHAQYIRQTVPAHREGCDWVVVALHYSTMGFGPHVHDRPVQLLRFAIASAISETDVDLVISGHDHEYNRSWLMGPEKEAPGSDGDTLVKKEGETLYMCLPTAVGTKFYKKSKEPFFPVAKGALKSARGYVIADFTPGSIVVEAWDAESGQSVDRFTLSRAS